MIVKVQLSLHSSSGKRRVIAYDKDKKHVFEGNADAELIAVMKDEPKAFFEAEVVNRKLVLNRRADWQDW